MSPIVPMENQRRNNSKAQIEVRTRMETRVNQGKPPKPDDEIKSVPSMKKMFSRLVRENPHFTENDSVPLNTLVFNLWLQSFERQKMIDNVQNNGSRDEYTEIQQSLTKITKDINGALKQLQMPLENRMVLANNLAKIELEEMKIDAMNGANQPVINPKQEKLMHILNK
ncbi:hypothetical protein P4501_11345 [Bacillus thuringiensis]|nr:hypothetical protein [Bacillus thuringiensis]